MVINFSAFAFRAACGKFLCSTHFPLFIPVRNETHYDVLKLPRSCTSRDIREAFISLSKENHPDKNQNDPSLHIRFVKINEAYRTLIKPSTRHAYDMTLGSKRKLSPPPPYSNSRTSSPKNEQGFRSQEQEFKSEEQEFQQQHDFNDPFMWHGAKGADETNDSYYGIKGVKKVSNSVIVWLLFAFTVVGVFTQIAIIRNSAFRRNEHMLEESRKNSLLESMLREKARLYGNDHQIELLKKSLSVTCDIDDSDAIVQESEPEPS